MKLKTPERIARSAFGSADVLKVQSQHERFLREIKTLPEKDKTEEIINAVKYLIQNKSDYWLETAHLLDLLMGDKEQNKKPLYLLTNPDITKTEFCKKYLGVSSNTVSSYLRVIRHFKDYGFSEEQIRVLGFGKTRDLIKNVPQGTISEYSKKSINELKKLRQDQIYHKKKKSDLDLLKHYWNKASTQEKKEFRKFLDEAK